MNNGPTYRAQVAELPVKGKPGRYQVLLVTSRETRRWIIPKGWPMKDRKDCEAAAQEALEEAGVIGRVHKHPMGAYTYEKRIGDATEHIRVMVYMLEVVSHADHWRERGQRDQEWVTTTEAAFRVEEPGLTEIIKRLDVGPRDARGRLKRPTGVGGTPTGLALPVAFEEDSHG